MRRILLLTSILLLSATWAMAQYDSDPYSSEGASRSYAYRTTAEGCLSGAVGNYTLTLPTGFIFQLTGHEAWMKQHVGETVRVAGIVQPVVRTPGSMSEGTETQPTMQVRALQRISGACSPTSNTIH